MPWLSVVIPLYNCEPYIAMCLDSILQQGLEESEYEVIVVNDGSTDKGADIASEYCKSYVNFRVLNKENGSISSARILGMDEAKGEYIYFVDADDRLIASGMRTLYDSYLRGKSHPDMVTFPQLWRTENMRLSSCFEADSLTGKYVHCLTGVSKTDFIR